MIGTLDPKLEAHAMCVVERAHAVTHLVLKTRESVGDGLGSVDESVCHVNTLLQIGVLIV